MKKTLIITFVFLTQACTLFKSAEPKSNSLTIKSEIDKVEVFDEKNIKLGDTPLSLDGAQFGDRASIYFIFKKSGYFDKEMSLNKSDLTEINVTLTPISEEYIKQNLDRFYSKEVNIALRKIVQVQEYISLKDYDSAESEAIKLMSAFPSASIIYTLLGIIEINRRNFQAAEIHLKKAVNLDPNDNLAQNYLGYIKQGQRNE